MDDDPHLALKIAILVWILHGLRSNIKSGLGVTRLSAMSSSIFSAARVTRQAAHYTLLSRIETI